MMLELSPLLTAAKPSARSIPARARTSRSNPTPVTRSPLNDGRSLRNASGSRSITATVLPRSSRMWASVEPTRPQPMITICTTSPFTVRHRLAGAGTRRPGKGMPSRGRMPPRGKENQVSDAEFAYAVGQTVEVTAVDVAQGGWCVARPEGLPVVFVRHALPGERVLARVTEVTSKFARADAVEIRRRRPTGSSRRARTPTRAAAAAATGSTRRCPPSARSRPPSSASSCTGWPGPSSTPRSPSSRCRVTRAGPRQPRRGDRGGHDASEAGQPGLGWRTRVQFAVARTAWPACGRTARTRSSTSGTARSRTPRSATWACSTTPGRARAPSRPRPAPRTATRTAWSSSPRRAARRVAAGPPVPCPATGPHAMNGGETPGSVRKTGRLSFSRRRPWTRSKRSRC